MHCDWTVDVKVSLGVECRGSTRLVGSVKTESDAVSFLAVVIIMIHGLGKSKISNWQYQEQLVGI